uniref:uncharacterized protein clmnb isoform X3 n=1 Tax=Centroberyx gerrardi TaxID=166262 RepID=UPI003AADDB7A
MATQDKASWDGQGKSLGEISEQEALWPQGEREAAQKRTFTRWMNVFLQRCEPPVEMHDLFTDIQDGRVLMALLEELSGCKLVYRFRPSSHRIFRLNNIAKALAFLDDRHVSLLGIDASGIADGNPSVVLNLVWSIILYFQIREVTAGLQRRISSSLSSLSMSSYPSSSDLSPPASSISSCSSSTLPSKGRRAARTPKYHGKTIKTLLHWVQRCTSKFGVEVHDFGKSWRSGLAFLAMIKSIDPGLVDLRDSLSRAPRENIQEAFMIAQRSLGIPPLLEPEDVTCTSPDERSVITYVSMFLEHYSGLDEDHTTDCGMRVNIPEIPRFASLESISFGEPLAPDPEAQALLKSQEKTDEQLLWKRWSRRSSAERHAASRHLNRPVTNNIFSFYSPQSSIEETVGDATTSQLNKGKSPGVFQPISPLDAGNVDQKIRSWMEKAAVDQRHSKGRVGEGNFSLSSEEGIYNLSALDSDEEDAYSYILDLNKDVFQSYNPLNRQAPMVEEETAEEMISNGELTAESKRLKLSEVSLDNGSECYSQHEESLLTQNGDFGRESEDREQSMDQGSIDVEESGSSVGDEQRDIRGGNRFRETVNNGEVLDMEEEAEDEGRGKEELEEERERVVREQDDGDDEEEEKKEKDKRENVRFVRQVYGERETPVDEAENAKLFEIAGWEREVEEETDAGSFEKFGQVRDKRLVEEEGEEGHLLKVEKGEEERRAGEQEEKLEDDVKKEEEAEKRRVVNFESFKVENQKTFIDEAVCEVTRTVRVNTEEEEDRRDSVAKEEDVSTVEEKEGNKDDNNEVMNVKDFEEVITAEEEDGEQEDKKHNTLTEEKATRIGHPTEITLENDTETGVNLHNDGKNNPHRTSATSQSFSEGGAVLQTSAASCEVTPLELELLLLLWILLYCYFILPQMNL